MHRYRTHTCAELRRTDAGREVRVSGWLHNRRDLGGLLFVDLRDHYGLVQLVARPGAAVFQQLSDIRKESVICVVGRVVERSAENINPDLPTGEVEVEVEQLEVLSAAGLLPFPVFPEDAANEESR